MNNSIITSLAILKVNFDELQKDYIENFVPLVAEAIRVLDDDYITTPTVKDKLIQLFKIDLPQNVIKTLFRRLEKYNYITQEYRVYKRNLEELNKLNFRDKQQKILAQHESLIKSMIVFVEEKFKMTWLEEEAESNLQLYLKEYNLILLKSFKEGIALEEPRPEFPKNFYIIGSFIKHLQDSYSSNFNYLESIIVGDMLANAMYLPNPSQAIQKFKGTEIYLDTTFLIYALGYAGKVRQDPCSELLHLLSESKAILRCFRPTADEIIGILESCKRRIASRKNLYDSYGTIEHFLQNNTSPTDIHMYILELEKNLRKLNISVVETPPYKERYSINEKKLREMFSTISYNNEDAREHDIKAISAIIRLRHGDYTNQIENCRALFVSTNVTLGRIANRFFSEEYSKTAVAPVMLDHELTYRLWLKKPTNAPNLPRKRIIADCFASIQPTERLWSNYLNEIDKLKGNNKLSNDDYFLLRYSLEAKSAIMDMTYGSETVFTEGTIQEILDIIHYKITEDDKKAILVVNEQLEKTKQQLAITNEVENRRLSNIYKRAEDYGRKLTRAIFLLIVESVKYSV